MGVPAFFRWLTLRYPKIVIEAREELDLGFNINEIIEKNIGEDRQMPSIDNLYFDMNGIIHPCAHPEDRDPPSSLEEMFNSIFDYCDKLIRIIKPKKLIYMAIDGVAPRAKMNQQRSRRFRAAIDAEQKERITKKIEKEWKDKGLPSDFLNIKNKTKFKFDSNFITPGSEFLEQCSSSLKLYIKSRINKDPLWKNLNVIFSDASVPGEGEHKILDFIRTQRNSDKYDPNTSHCIYGADADLIMLSLIMHEPHFYVIRESINENYYLICDTCGRHGHTAKDCKNFTGKFNKNEATEEQISNYNKKKINEIEFSLLKIGVLREYLEIEFKDLITQYSFERIIDDFVFLCFLVGNDFLPNLPSLKIREGGIDALIFIYKNLLPEMKDHLTNGKGQLNLEKCQILFGKLSLIEDEFFKKEIQNKTQDEQRKKNIHLSSKSQKNNILDIFRNYQNDKKNKKDLQTFDKEKFNQIIKEEIYEENNKKIDEYIDNIKLGQRGWKDRYYMEKFHISFKNDKKGLTDLKEKIKKYYIEGLCWVFEYYYNGCVSWSWFYPFHYAPFASDLDNLNNIKIDFELGEPFFPFEQLLSVLPPYSAGALPPCFQQLMKDPLSPIADFYPKNIKLDINNQPYAWMGVNLLPFIDAERVHKIVEIVINENKDELNKKAIKLNKRGDNILISKNIKNAKYLDGEFIVIDNIGEKDKNIKRLHLEEVKEDKSNIYIFKKLKTNKKHCSEILNGVKLQKKCVIEDNLDLYKKNKFKGMQAIEIVKKILGYTNEDIENYFLKETFDEYGNNNRDFNYEPKKKFLLRKKRFKENFNKEHKSYRNKSNNPSNKSYNNRIRINTRSNSNSLNNYDRNKSRYNTRNKSHNFNKGNYRDTSNRFNYRNEFNKRKYSNENNPNKYSKSKYNRGYRFNKDNYNRNYYDEVNYSKNMELNEDNEEKHRKPDNRRTKKKYNLRYKK